MKANPDPRQMQSFRRGRAGPTRLPPASPSDAVSGRSIARSASPACPSAISRSCSAGKSTRSSAWSWLKQENTTDSRPGLGIDMRLQALRAHLLHHALHRRVDRPDRACGPAVRYGASTPCRAAPTACIMRSEPMTIMCSASRQRHRLLAQLTRSRRPPSPARCCRQRSGPAAAPGSARSPAPHRSTRR